MGNVSIVSSPVSQISSAVSDVFGSNDYSFNNLLHIQMEMLYNISQKIELIQKQMDLIFDKLDEIKALQLKVPEKVVAELYRTDLKSIFLLAEEKLTAYVRDRDENNAKSAKKFEGIFEDLLTEIQLARVRIFVLNKYLNLPMISTCLHFEIFCMVLSKQPRSLIETTLSSYKKWIQDCLDSELNDLYDYHLKEQDRLIGMSKSFFAYSKCLIEKSSKPGGEGTADSPTYVIYVHKTKINKFRYIQQFDPETEQRIFAQVLIDNNLISAQHLPSKLVKEFVKSIEYSFEIKAHAIGYVDHTVRKFAIDEDLTISESDASIEGQLLCSVVNPTNNIPGDVKDVTDTSASLVDNGERLVLFASLKNIASQSLLAIDKFLDNGNNLDINSIIEFGIKQENFSRINNQRAIEWIKFIDSKIDLIEQEEQKAKLKNLRDQMASLNANSKNIYTEYQRLEKELAESLSPDLLSGVAKLLEPIGKELEKGMQNVVREHEKFVGDLERNLEKAIQDAGRELEVAVQNVGEAFDAGAGFLENQFNSSLGILPDATRRLVEGKVVDALWHIAIDPLKNSDDNLATMFMESTLLTSIASSVAAMYGGPYGAAAFSAWLTYKNTGDLELALKTGAITYFTHRSLAGINKTITGTDVTDIAKRTLMTSLVGAAAIAAGGGTEKDIIDGFLKGAALTMASEAYKTMIEEGVNEEIPTEDALDKDDEATIAKYGELKDGDGNPMLKRVKEGDKIVWKKQIDPGKIPSKYPQIGFADNKSALGEDSFLMKDLFGKVPGMNAMARFHDKWCALAGTDEMLGGAVTVVTIIPAIALTMGARKQILIDDILEALNHDNE